MGIQPMDRTGTVPKAAAVCDECARREVITCDYEGSPARGWRVNEGQGLTKVRAQGWAVIRGRLLCPRCDARRKAIAASKRVKMENEVKAAPPAPAQVPREPTGAQKRIIILALEDAYDDRAMRYRGEATDHTLAAELGDGIMSGWVAALREEMFGPDGGNEEIARLMDEVEKLSATIGATSAAVERLLQDAQSAAATLKAAQTRQAEIVKRIEAVKVAVGPRAVRV